MRKLISIVLTLALVLGSLGFTASAASKPKLLDIADNANEEAIQVAYDLGIVEGTPEGNFEPDKAVTRAEFAALITRALAIPQSALASYGGASFLDTAGATWAVPYLAFCQQKGIMKGDGYGNAMPQRTISPNEAVTMVLRAIGYTDSASVLVGQWPANYVSLGQSQLLYTKVADSTEMNKAAAAQMIYNALTVQLVQVDANAAVSLLWNRINATREDPRSLLTAGLDCEYVEKAVITYADAASSKINLTPYVGNRAALYKSNADDEVVAVTEIDTTLLPGQFTYSGTGADTVVDKFKSIDGTEYNLSGSVKSLFSTANNGDVTVDAAKVAKFQNGNDNPSAPAGGDWYSYVSGTEKAQAKLVIGAKISGKTITELSSIAVWEAVGTFLWASDSLDGKKIEGYELPLDNNDDIDLNAFTLEGVNTLEEIAVDNVVYVFRNSSSKISKIQVGTKSQSGVVTNYNDVDSEGEIGGSTYGFAPYTGSGISDIKSENAINNEGTALLDYYGRIYDFKLSEASKGSYAVFEDYGYTGSQLNQVPVIKLLDKTGKEISYEATKKYAELPATNVDSWLAMESLVTATGRTGYLVEYSISSGKLSKMNQEAEVNGRERGYIGDINTKYSSKVATVNKAGSMLSVAAGYVGGTSGKAQNYIIDSGAVVFVKSGDDYQLGTINDILDSDLNYGFNIFRDGNKIKAILVNEADAGASSAFVMVTARSRSASGTDTVDKLTGYDFKDATGASKKTWLYTNDNFLGELESVAGNYDAKVPFPELLKFSVTENGVLKNVERITADADRFDLADIDDTKSHFDGVKVLEYSGSSGGTFTLTVSDGVNDNNVNYVSFESTTVLYKVDGSSWAPAKFNQGQINSNKDAKYIFLKTDSDNAFNVIIQVR
ncbi:MAG: S-layer homology domain-containing protein [Clostridiales Family XIII bacterium]|jgi:hypothetical protein|nr:S-layer homology domain-containing protein [Clostridiales Family XIII bacterium]